MAVYDLGLHIGHDASAALLRNGELVYAEEEERLSRHKNHFGFPAASIANALSHADIQASDVDAVAIGWDVSRLHAHRTSFARRAEGSGELDEANRKQKRVATILQYVELLPSLFPEAAVMQVDHHVSHASSVVPFAPGGLDVEGLPALVMDGIGEDQATSVFESTVSPETAILHLGGDQSIGLFYQRWAEVLGFRGRQAPGYLMSLSAHGDPSHTAPWFYDQFLEHHSSRYPLIRAGTFDPAAGRETSAWRCFPGCTSLPAPYSTLSDPWELRDLAAGVQEFTERLIVGMVRWLADTRGVRLLTLSGGVFLNCLAIGRVRRELPGVELLVGPASKDSGVAVGAAIQAYRRREGASPPTKGVGAYLGTDIREDPTWEALRRDQIGEVCSPSTLVRDLLDGRTIAVADGRLEFGPRALGARSILASAGREGTAERLNLVKDRFSFQPLAGSMSPSVATEVFGLDGPEPFMSSAYRARARVDEVRQILNPHDECRLHVIDRSCPRLLEDALTGYAASGELEVVVNTSFNGKGEPLAATASDALATFRSLDVDVLYGPSGFRLEKQELTQVTRARARNSLTEALE